MSLRPVIGLVEDNNEDVLAFRRAFGPRADIEVWASGEALISSLLGEASLLERLDLLFVDLGLPGIDGTHLAHTIRGSHGGAHLPIIVLSGSQAESDIIRALKVGVTEYEVKPSSLADLRALVDRSLAMIRPSDAWHASAAS